jgi:hypothetical protein
MRSLVRSILLLGILLFVLLSAAPSEAIINEYVEDFFTTQHRDTLNTTALWDVVMGELKLPPYEPTIVGTYNAGGAANGVTVSGDHVFVASAYGGLDVLDISDPTNPAYAGGCGTPGNAYDVTVSGNYAFVPDGSPGLQVIDISDPTNPTIAGTCDTPGNDANGVTVSGDHAFVVDRYLGLHVIDISDPVNPTLAGTCDTPGDAYGVTVSGDHAFVADGASGLQVIDISDPTNPTLAGTCDTPSEAWGVTVSGDHAFVADDYSGLQMIDISDPTNPTLAGTCNTPSRAYDVTVSGDRAFVADGTSGLQVIDISDPTNPTLTGTCDTAGVAYDVTVSGDHAFVADGTSSLQVIRIADPMLPPRAAGDSDVSGEMNDLVIAGDHAYVASSAAGGVAVISISDPTSPALVGSYATPGGLRDIALDGDRAYLADGGSGFRVLDVSDPTNPLSVGTLSLPGWAKYVAVEGNYAYVGCDYTSQSFNVIDISDPTSPTLAGYLYHSPGMGNIAVEGNYVFFGMNDFYSVDISDPTAPTIVGSCVTPGNLGGFTIAGDHAYVADQGVGLQVTDISDPANLSIVGTCNLTVPSTHSRVAVSGDYAYVGDGPSGLRVVDISDPTNPVLLATYVPPTSVYWLAMAGDYLYMTQLTGLHVVEVFQGRYDTDGDTGQSLAVDERDDSILWARLTTTQVDSVTWELSADGGSAWEPFALDDDWYQFTSPGSDLLWKSTHTYVTPGVNPACTDIRIQWLCGYASIESIVDVGNDQGRQVRVSWQRSGHDYLGSSAPITDYAIYRRQDDLPIAMRSQSAVRSDHALPWEPPDQSRFYPPGDWDFVGAVPACCEDEYAVVVPTLADSTITGGMYYTTFYVRALTDTPGVYFDALPDSGYSVDNLAPAVPAGFAVNYTIVSGNELSWEASEDEDFQHFRVYRDDNEEFEPSPENLIHMTIAVAWVDPEGTGWDHYKITALDHAGNESDPASPESITGVDEPAMPARFALYRSVPNPLRSGTEIAYDVPADGGEVTLTVYNVAGRRVRTLVDGPQTPGRKSATWDGRDDRGNVVGSGVYYCRLEATGYEQSIKITVLR